MKRRKTKQVESNPGLLETNELNPYSHLMKEAVKDKSEEHGSILSQSFDMPSSELKSITSLSSNVLKGVRDIYGKLLKKEKEATGKINQPSNLDDKSSSHNIES